MAQEQRSIEYNTETTEIEKKQSRKIADDAQHRIFLADLVGKKLWYVPGKFMPSFYKVVRTYSGTSNRNLDQKFTPTSQVYFEILDYFLLSEDTFPGWRERYRDYQSYGYRVRIEDGTIGFIYAESVIGKITNNFEHKLSSNVRDLDDSINRNFFTADPAVIRADAQEQEIRKNAEEKQRFSEKKEYERHENEAKLLSLERQRDAYEKESKRKGGVRIGMNKKQVIASNWGRPSSVNKTTTANGISEQWVYDGSYLYFENGILRTIQN